MQIQSRRLIPGLILILLGLAFLLTEFFGFKPGMIFILAAVIFLVPYLFTRWYGLLVPGMILLGLGIGLLTEPGTGANTTVPLGLGVGFLGIFLVDFIVTRRARWWPLIPGVILAVIGLADTLPQTREYIEKGWPVILILGGLLILARDFLPRDRPKTGSQ